jgi:hypothetical protein
MPDEEKEKGIWMKNTPFYSFFRSQIDSPSSLSFVINSSSYLLVQCFKERERTSEIPEFFNISDNI